MVCTHPLDVEIFAAHTCFAMQPFNILRYNLGQHYDAHYDVFDPGNNPSFNAHDPVVLK